MKLRHAMVCSSNQNMSMESHALLKREGFDVASYGTGQHVKLPGPSLREPKVLEDLRRKDPELNATLPSLQLPCLKDKNAKVRTLVAICL